jgi:hypothetical protein
VTRFEASQRTYSQNLSLPKAAEAKNLFANKNFFLQDKFINHLILNEIFCASSLGKLLKGA